MTSTHLLNPRRASGWLVGLALLFTGLSASAQQDPPGVVARLNYNQGSVSFSPAGDDSWYDAVVNRPITTGDRLWTDRGARAEVSVGSAMLRMDDQTSVTVSELDDDTARITALQGSLQLRVREDMAGQRFEIDTANLAVVIDAPGDYRIDADPASGTTRVAIASGNATLYGEGGESLPLGGRQQLTVSGRALAAVSGAPVRASGGFDQWVAERSRIEDQSISARYVSREVVGYQQLDNNGDWRNEADYGAVWYPRNVDADWAPYRDGQWVDVAPWGWTWVDAAPWGFAPSHYGRWARIGPRWGWVPGQRQARPVYSPALVGFVGGGGGNANLAIGGGRNGVGWFPLAPGEAWRPGYRTSQRYIDEANRAGAYNRQQAARAGTFANQTAPGAITIVPIDVFGRGPIGRRDAVRLPDERFAARAAVGTAVPIPLRGDRPFAGIGRPAPQPVFQVQQQQAFQAQQAQQVQQMQQQQRELLRQQQQQPPLQGAQGFERTQDAMRQQQQLQFQQRAAQAQAQGQAQQFQQAQQMQQMQQQQQREAARQQQEVMQRGVQAQAQQQQMQQLQQQQQLQLQQQQAMRQQQEMQQRAAQAQAQNQQLQLQQQQMQLQQQQAMRAQQQQQQLMQAQQQQGAMRQAQELQQRALQQQQQQRQQQMQRSGMGLPQQQQQP